MDLESFLRSLPRTEEENTPTAKPTTEDSSEVGSPIEKRIDLNSSELNVTEESFEEDSKGSPQSTSANGYDKLDDSKDEAHEREGLEEGERMDDSPSNLRRSQYKSKEGSPSPRQEKEKTRERKEEPGRLSRSSRSKSEERLSNSQKRSKSSSRSPSPEETSHYPTSRHLWVSGLNNDITEKDLENAFKKVNGPQLFWLEFKRVCFSLDI